MLCYIIQGCMRTFWLDFSLLGVFFPISSGVYDLPPIGLSFPGKFLPVIKEISTKRRTPHADSHPEGRAPFDHHVPATSCTCLLHTMSDHEVSYELYIASTPLPEVIHHINTGRFKLSSWVENRRS